jgi:nucleotide-binding universal stress UspA family protein
MMQTKTFNYDINIPEIRKIILAVDGSESSLRACEGASIVARAVGATVAAVYVLPRSVSLHAGPSPDEHARASLEKAAAMIASVGDVKAESKIIQSHSLSVSESLIEYITNEKADLTICGDRGQGGFERMLLGSVTGNLVAHSPTSVMVVKPPETADKKIRFDRILVATDGSETASRGVGAAIGLAKALQSKVTFVNVVYLPPASYTFGEGEWFDKAIEEYKEEGRRITEYAATIARKNGVEADTRVTDDMHSPVEVTTTLAQEGNYDLIAVGTRGLGKFKRLALGSTASGVAHYAHCSVLVAR